MDTGVQRNKTLVSALIQIPMGKASILRYLTVIVQLCAWHLCLVENTEKVYRDICGCLSHIHQLLFLFEDPCDEEADGTPSSTGGTCVNQHIPSSPGHRNWLGTDMSLSLSNQNIS